MVGYVPYWEGLVVERECSYDENDKLRFLSKCSMQPHPRDPNKMCLIYSGGRSRGAGKHHWYGSFWTKGKTVRAHVFYALAFLKKRRSPGDQYDHECTNTRCVSCIEVVPGTLNASWSRGGRGRHG